MYKHYKGRHSIPLSFFNMYGKFQTNRMHSSTLESLPLKPSFEKIIYVKPYKEDNFLEMVGKKMQKTSKCLFDHKTRYE